MLATSGVSGTATGSSTATTSTGVSNVAITGSTTGLSATNYDFTKADGTLTINKAPATVTANSDTKTYTGGSQSVSGFTASGLVNGESTSVLSGVSAGASGTNAGSYTATAGVGSYSGNYTLSFVDGKLTINKAPLIIVGSKVYDGSSAMPGTYLTGLGVNGETFALTGAGSPGNLGNKNVQSGSTLSSVLGLVLSTSSNGGLTGNYSDLSTTGSSINVTPKALTGSIAPGSSAYGATLLPGAATLSGVLPGDVVAPGAVAVNTTGSTSTSGHLKAGSYTGIESVSATLSGADAGNYTFAGASGNYSVSTLSLPITGITASNKVYDTTTSASLLGTASVATLNNDVVNVSGVGTGAFADANVGTGKAVTVSGYTLAGADAGNYAVRQPAGLTADINPAQQQPVESVTTQLATTVFSPKAETRPDALHLLPTITVTQSGSPNTAPPVADAAAFVDSLPPAATGPNSSSTASSTDSSSPPPSSNTVVNTMMTIGGGMGPALQIITGGIRLPANVAIILQ